MKILLALTALLLSAPVLAKEPTSIGQGRYMLSDQNFTIFGSTDKIVAKLMKQSQEFCMAKEGKEAVMLESGGSEAEPGRINNSGRLQHAAKGAMGTIYFQCGAPEPTVAARDDKYDALAKLKSLLDSGALTEEEYGIQKKKLLGE
jgi:hypothetical protein